MIELILNVVKRLQNDKYNADINIQYNDTTEDLLTTENNIDITLPDELKMIHDKFSKVHISWKRNDKRGYFVLLSLKEIYRVKEDFKTFVTDFCLYSELDEKESIKQDLLSWIPVLYFPNGDYFCIDTRTGAIVLFDHEITEDYLNLHGIKIANNFNELIKKWSKVLFVDIYDWSLGVDENGLNLSEKIFDGIL